jgi:hypothetical protein
MGEMNLRLNQSRRLGFRSLVGRLIAAMGETNVRSKEECHFLNVLGIWAKLCHAKGTLEIARESPVAILGCGEVWGFPHAQSLRSTSSRGTGLCGRT